MTKVWVVRSGGRSCIVQRGFEQEWQFFETERMVKQTYKMRGVLMFNQRMSCQIMSAGRRRDNE